MKVETYTPIFLLSRFLKFIGHLHDVCQVEGNRGERAKMSLHSSLKPYTPTVWVLKSVTP